MTVHYSDDEHMKQALKLMQDNLTRVQEETRSLREETRLLKTQLGGLTPQTEPPREGLPARHKLEKLNHYRSENIHEWALLSNRVSAYITSQSFLVTAYAISMGNLDPHFRWFFPPTLCLVGLLSSIRAYPGIEGATIIISQWRRKQDRLFLLNPKDPSSGPDPDMEDFNDGRMGAQPEPGRLRTLITKLMARKKPATVELPEQTKDKPMEPSSDTSADKIHKMSLFFATLAPKLFGWTWIALAALSIGLALWPSSDPSTVRP